MFQSRNRDAFLFKDLVSVRSAPDTLHRFNLVIEMLFFSRPKMQPLKHRWGTTFQSRNRDAFLFKITSAGARWMLDNLSFQSRNRDAFLFKASTCWKSTQIT